MAKFTKIEFTDEDGETHEFKQDALQNFRMIWSNDVYGTDGKVAYKGLDIITTSDALVKLYDDHKIKNGSDAGFVFYATGLLQESEEYPEQNNLKNSELIRMLQDDEVAYVLVVPRQ